MLLPPPSYDEIAENEHPVRKVSDVIDQFDLGGLFSGFKSAGAASFYPESFVICWLMIICFISIRAKNRRQHSIKRSINVAKWDESTGTLYNETF